MCGIVGFFENKLQPGQVARAVLSQIHRGEDSFGFIGVDAHGVLHAYKALDFSPFLKALHRLEGREFVFFIAHHRAASVGAKTLENAHPVFLRRGRVFIIQNGTKRALAIAGRSDTYGIGVLYSAGELTPALLQGAGVVFIIDARQKKVIFHKDPTRTLYVKKDSSFFSSEPTSAGTWVKVKEGYYEFPIKEFTSLPLESHEIEVSEVEVKLCDLCLRRGIIVEKIHKVWDVCTKCAELPHEKKEEKIEKRVRTYYSSATYRYRYY